MKRKMFHTALIIFAGLLPCFANDPTKDAEKYTIKVRPVVEQCAELKDTDDSAITAIGKELATADAAKKISHAAALAKTCSKRSTPLLLGLLQDKDMNVRIAAIEALGNLGDKDSVEALVDLRSEPWQIRFALGPALVAFPVWNARYNAMNFVASSSEVTLDENDIRARCITILSLHQLIDVSFSRKSMRFLIAYLDSENEKIRSVAQETMLEMKKTRNFAFEIVGELRQAMNPSVRKKCAYWIGELKIERGRDTLADKAANDDDPEVRKIAAEALKKLGVDENAETAPVKVKQPSTTTPKAAKPRAKK